MRLFNSTFESGGTIASTSAGGVNYPQVRRNYIHGKPTSLYSRGTNFTPFDAKLERTIRCTEFDAAQDGFR